MKSQLILAFHLCVLLGYGSTILSAQTPDDQVADWRTDLRQASGVEKLKLYHQLIEANLEQNDAMALRDAQLAQELAEYILIADNGLVKTEDLSLKPKTYLLMGQALESRNRIDEAIQAYTDAITSATEIRDMEQLTDAEERLVLVSNKKGEKKNPLGRAVGGLFSKTAGGLQDLGFETALRMATYNEKKSNYPAAIKHYNKAIARLINKGEAAEAEKLRLRVVQLESPIAASPSTPSPPLPPMEGIEILEEVDDSIDMALIDQQVSNFREEFYVDDQSTTEEENETVNEMAVRAVVLDKAERNVVEIANSARKAEESRDYAASLDYYKQFLALEQQLTVEQRRQDSSLAQIQLLKSTNILQSEINQQELQQQRQAKRSMAGGLGLAAALATSLLILYRNKTADHKKLGAAFNDLEETQKELNGAQRRVKQLLKQHVSGAVADELLTEQGIQGVSRKFVCIMFLDIRDFTPFAEKHKPEEIIDYQNKVFGSMIDVINEHGGIVNQILGDGFMATFGAPVSSGNDCANAYQAARKIIKNVAERSKSGEIPPTRVGVGLHAGNVVAGNVGTNERKQYSITGSAVIIASRLEQLNKEFGSSLVLSKDVYDIVPTELRKPMKFEPVDIKGRTEPIEVAYI